MRRPITLFQELTLRTHVASRCHRSSLHGVFLSLFSFTCQLRVQTLRRPFGLLLRQRCSILSPVSLGQGRFSIDGAVSSISVWAHSRSGSTVACGFIRCRLSFLRTSIGHRFVRKESGFRLHSGKGVISLFIAMMFCSLKLWLVWPAKVCLSGRGAPGMCEVDSNCAHERATVRIDVTIKSTGTLMFLRPTVGAKYLFRHSRRLSRFPL